MSNLTSHALAAAAIALAACLPLLPAESRAAAPAVVTTTATLLKPPPVLAPDLSKTLPVASPSLVGRWSSSDSDKETGLTETLVIEFKADGSYSTQLQDNKFKPARFSGSGRYSVTDADKSGFTLVVRRQMDDPESDKANASETQRITWVDKDTLRAADGSVIRRAR